MDRLDDFAPRDLASLAAGAARVHRATPALLDGVAAHAMLRLGETDARVCCSAVAVIC
jgi:hypothetical protein